MSKVVALLLLGFVCLGLASPTEVYLLGDAEVITLGPNSTNQYYNADTSSISLYYSNTLKNGNSLYLYSDYFNISRFALIKSSGLLQYDHTSNTSQLGLVYVNKNSQVEVGQFQISAICNENTQLTVPAGTPTQFASNSRNGYYASDRNCTWEYTVSTPGYLATLQFDYYSTQNLDKTLVRGGTLETTFPLADSNTAMQTSSNNKLSVLFSTDSYVSYTGFRGTFSSTAASCAQYNYQSAVINGHTMMGVTQGTDTFTCAGGYAAGNASFSDQIGQNGGSQTLSFTCLGSGPGTSSWSPSINSTESKCLPVLCDSKNVPTGYSGADATTLISQPTDRQATVRCAPGYAIIMTSTTAAMQYRCVGNPGSATSYWDPNPDVYYCRPIPCNVTVTTNTVGHINLTGVTGSTVTSTCANGYAYSGSTYTKTFSCIGSGLTAYWSPTPEVVPNKCMPVSCSDFYHSSSTTASGIHLGGVTGASTVTMCKPGYTFGGENSTTYQQTFTCAASGPATSQWSPNTGASSSRCAAMNCPIGEVSGHVSNGASLTGATGGSVTATCAWGYSFGNLATQKTFTCTGTGNATNTWSPDVSQNANQCSPVNCPEYDHSSSTTASGTMLTGVTGDSIVTSCKPGYTFGGQSSTTYQQTFTCNASGPAASQWSPNTGASSSNCAPMNCNATTVLGHVASALLTGVTDGSATATCSYGYSFGGLSSDVYSKTFTCTGTGDATNAWQPDVSLGDNECLPMTCPTYTFADSVAQNVTYLSGVTGDSIVVTCSLGYVIGHTTATTATFSCTGTGNAVNAWLPAPADNLCIQLQCNDYTHPANTVQSGAILSGGANSVAQSECVDGFSFGGGASQAAIMNFTCAVNTPPVTVSWSPDTSSSSSHCSPMNCAAYTDFTSDTVMPGSTLFGATNADSSVTCAYGYTVGGGSSSVYSSTYTCTGDSPSSGVAHNHWAPTPDANVCQAMNCPAVNFSSLAVANISSLDGVTGDSVLITCASGYGVNGTNVSSQTYTCDGTGNANNAWFPNPSVVKCMPLDCPTVVFEHATLLHTQPSPMTGYVGSNFSITCSYLYSIGGGDSTLIENTFQCIAGGPGIALWSPSPYNSSNICRPVANSPSDVREDRDFKRNNRHLNHQQQRDARKLKKLYRSPVEASPRHHRNEGRRLFSVEDAEVQQTSLRASPLVVGLSVALVAVIAIVVFLVRRQN